MDASRTLESGSLQPRVLEIHTSPHIASGSSVEIIMRNVVWALLPTAAWAIWAFGLAGLLLLTTAIATCLAAEHLVCRFSGSESTVNDWSVVITGLEANIEEHRVVNDLLTHVGAQRNPKGRLDVERDFEVRGTISGEGRIFASGSMTLGGYYAGVDSFLGLQYASLRIHDALAELGFGEKIGVVRSTKEWWKWARNVAL